MLIARVIGSAVSTAKSERLKARKLLIVQETNPQNELMDRAPFVAVDAVGAGSGELVLITIGSGGRYTDMTDLAPSDATIVGIIDSLEIDGRNTFEKR
jgi:microcompartment protein CcmK/EutM